MSAYNHAFSALHSTTSHRMVPVAVVTQPLPRVEAWQESMEPQKTGNSLGPGPEVVQRQRIAKERAAQSP